MLMFSRNLRRICSHVLNKLTDLTSYSQEVADTAFSIRFYTKFYRYTYH